jgi:uncharacterized metal-binding protein
MEKEKDKGKTPKNCPMRDEKYMEEIFEAYKEPKTHEFYLATKTAGQPGTAPRFTPRLRYVIDLCKKMGYKKIGLAFCVKFTKEADLYSQILRKHGLDVVSVICCNGGFNIADFGVPLPSGCEFDAACNPLGQARLMNEQGVEFNLVMGLCAGHDSLFIKNADAMSTVICVKDPATGHCPPKALYLYDEYYKPYFEPPKDTEEK